MSLNINTPNTFSSAVAGGVADGVSAATVIALGVYLSRALFPGYAWAIDKYPRLVGALVCVLLAVAGYFDILPAPMKWTGVVALHAARGVTTIVVSEHTGALLKALTLAKKEMAADGIPVEEMERAAKQE
jgi:hypothetical protein